MPKRRKRKAYKKKGSFKLKQDTIYTLSSIGLLFIAALMFLSYTQNGEVLQTIHQILNDYFGFFAFLAPINLIFFALYLSRAKFAIARPNVFVGFLLFTIAIIGIFRTGMVGNDIFFYLNQFLGPIVSYLLLMSMGFIGFVVLMNLSFKEIFGFMSENAAGVAKSIGGAFVPLLKTKDKLAQAIKQPIAIRGINEPKIKEAEIAPAEKISLQTPLPMSAKKTSEFPDDVVVNPLSDIGIWESPPHSLLTAAPEKKRDSGDVKKIAAVIEDTLHNFGIKAQVVEINVGPSVTQYAIKIPQGVRLTKITTLANDLALATEAPTGQIRIEAPIPGQSLVGIEIPNKSLQYVGLREMLESKVMQQAKSKLSVPLGLNVSGEPVVTDISRMPHVLIAGTTGSGKSVMVNTIIASILFHASPNEVRFIMIDPKRVELTGYNDIPHLLSPVVVAPEKAVSALKWALKEMDKRYTKFAEAGVKNIDGYNELSGFQAIPYIVIVMDELADLMALAPVDVEDCIARLAQMARATGIHLVLATQRPSVDVITGLIKANIPCRIAFNVSSGIDSKVIIDGPGAEKLLGRGDMLYVPPDQARPTRIQGTFVSDQDVKRLVNYIKSKGIPVQYTSEVVEQAVNIKGRGGSTITSGGGDEKDDLFEEAITLVCQHDKASASLLQRRFHIGFNRAARLLEQLEEHGIVGAGEGAKPREVLVRSVEEYYARVNNQPEESEV